MPDSAFAAASDGTASSLPDLPELVQRNVIDHLSRTTIAGAQRHAAVSKFWRQQSAGKSELLHLLVQQEGSTRADAAEVVAYLKLHGQHVQSLQLLGRVPHNAPVLQQALCGNRACLSNLTTLVLERDPTFLDLTPYLPRLSRLQHLTASVSLQESTRHSDHEALLVGPHGVLEDNMWGSAVPKMANMCPPSLTSLTLHIYVKGRKTCLDGRLQNLLPPRLQRLQLLGAVGPPGMRLQPGTLQHLSHLRHLSLHSTMPAAVPELEELDSLQELALSSIQAPLGDLASLSDKVTAYGCVHGLGDTGSLALFTALTALTFRLDGPHAAAALAPLTQLQQLHIYGMLPDTGAGPLLAGLTSISSLRRLRLEGQVPGEQLASVAQLTQLTSLVMGQLAIQGPAGQQQQQQQQQQRGGAGLAGPGPQQEEWVPAGQLASVAQLKWLASLADEELDVSPPGPDQQQQQQQQHAEHSVGPGPQQEEQCQDARLQLVRALRGLRHLEIPEELLLAAGGQQMLDALPALTRLDVCAIHGRLSCLQESWMSLRGWLDAGPEQLPPSLQQQLAVAAGGGQELLGQQLLGQQWLMAVIHCAAMSQQQEAEVVEEVGATTLGGGGCTAAAGAAAGAA